METSPIVRLPGVHPTAGELDGDVWTAIELVASGAARRVVLAGIPGVEDLAAEAIARAQRAHVALSLVRSQGSPPAIVVGPRDA